MIIDADCHISSQRWDGLTITADDLLEQMDRNGVDKALIWLKPFTRDINTENRAVYEATYAHPTRFIGFGWVNPRLGHEHAHATIRQCFDEYGLHGIKFNGAQDYYVIDDEEVLPFVEQAAAYGKCIAFHIGADFYENTHPYRLGRIAARFPDTRFLMVHMGGAGTPDLSRSAIEVAAQHSNIMLVGSAINERPILTAIKQLGAERVCFGSDTPFGMMHVRLAMYQAMLRDHAVKEREMVMGGNLLRWVG